MVYTWLFHFNFIKGFLTFNFNVLTTFISLKERIFKKFLERNWCEVNFFASLVICNQQSGFFTFLEQSIYFCNNSIAIFLSNGIITIYYMNLNRGWLILSSLLISAIFHLGSFQNNVIMFVKIISCGIESYWMCNFLWPFLFVG